MSPHKLVKSSLLPLGLLALAAGLAGCSKTPESQPAADTAAADAARADQLKAREDELAKREAELAAKQQEQEAAAKAADEAAQKERDAAEKTAAAKKAAAAAASKVAAAKSSSKPSSSSSTAAPEPKPAPKPVPKPIDVPAGTQLTVALTSDLTSKTAKVGDPFEASLVSDLVIDGRTAVPAGTRATGTITDVISGSRAIGAVPMLGLKFDSLMLKNQQIPIHGELKEQGKSEKGRDTAKILGGAAAGAVLGHQVKKGDSGKIIGGLLGGAVGAVAAKKTGTEVTLAAGSTLTISLGEGFRVANP